MTRKQMKKEDKTVKDKVSMTMINKQSMKEKDGLRLADATAAGSGGGAVVEVNEKKVAVDVEEDTTTAEEGQQQQTSSVGVDSGSTVTTTTTGTATATSRTANDATTTTRTATTRTTTSSQTNNDGGYSTNEAAALEVDEEEQLVVAELVTSDGMTTIGPTTTTGSDDGDVIDDPDLEARIRDQILQEGGEAQIIKIEKHDNKDSSGRRSSSTKTKMITLILSVLALVIIIIIGILVGNVLPSRLANKNKTTGGGSNGAEKTRREELVDLLLPLYGENKDYNNDTGIDFFLSFLSDVDDSQEEEEVDNIMDDVVTNTPQYNAFQWMVNIDKYDLQEQVDENNSNVLNPNDYVSKLLERYVLAVLYYATDGDNSWKDRTNFLTETSSVCEWNGIHNNNDDGQEEEEEQENENGDNIINNMNETTGGSDGDGESVEVENDPFATIPGVECDDRSGQVAKIRLGKR